jgi:hypothetical protein
MSGSGRTGQEFSVSHPVAGSIGHRLIQTSPGGGTGAEILSLMLGAGSWRHYALQRAIPMPPELAAQRSLAGAACGGRGGNVCISATAQHGLKRPLRFRHAAMSPLPEGEGAMSPPCLYQDERVCRLKMKGPVVTPTPQAGRSGSGSSTPYAPPRVAVAGRTAAQSLPVRR